MANRWLIVDTPAEFRAEFRPNARTAGILSAVASGATLASAGLALGFRADVWWVLTITLACLAAFPVALFFGLRRSVYRVILNFEKATAKVRLVRSFDPPTDFEVGLDEVDIVADSTRLIITWREQPDSALTIETHDNALPTSVLERTRSTLARRV